MGEVVKLEPKIGSRLETLTPVFPTVPNQILIEKVKQSGTFLGFGLSELLVEDMNPFLDPISPVLVRPDELGFRTEWLRLEQMRQVVERRHLRGLTPRMVLELLLLPRFKISGFINILLARNELAGYVQLSVHPGKRPHIGLEYGPVRDRSCWFLRRS